MSYRIILPQLIAAALFLLGPSPAFAEELALPRGAETAGNALPSEIMLRAARLMQGGGATRRRSGSMPDNFAGAHA